MAPSGAILGRRKHDVPSAILALVLEAFYLSNDQPALRAVYGRDADVKAHDEWVETLKASGDAGELGKMFHLAVWILVVLGGSIGSPVKRLVAALGTWSLLPLVVCGAIAIKYTSQHVKLAALSIGKILLQVFDVYQEVMARFQQAVPVAASWEQLASTNAKDRVLLRACLHTLARSPLGERSAEELARKLPRLGVPQREAAVRQVLRDHDCFYELWRGRWQVGEVARLLPPDLEGACEAELR